MQSQAYRILLVDDDADLCRGWGDVLSLGGHDVDCVMTGKEAYEHALARTAYDVVIADYFLPDTNGLRLIQEIRGIFPRQAAVLLTGSREQEIADAASAMGVPVLYKPISTDDLEAALRLEIERRRR